MRLLRLSGAAVCLATGDEDRPAFHPRSTDRYSSGPISPSFCCYTGYVGSNSVYFTKSKEHQQMATNPPHTARPEAQPSSVIQWLLDSDPSIRWQVMRDLTDAPAEEVAAERARVATEGWGARLLALQGADGSWGGAAWNHGWDSTMHVLSLLRELGLDPASDEARRAVGLVRDRVTWRGWDWDGTWRGGTSTAIPSSPARSSRASTGRWRRAAPTSARTSSGSSTACSASSCPTAAGTARPRTARRGRRSTPRSACWKPCSNTNWPAGAAPR